MIRSDMIEAMEFPHLVNKYQVSGVPLTIVNEVLRIEGALPEEMFIDRLTAFLDPSAGPVADKQSGARD